MASSNDSYLPTVYNTGIVRGDDFSETFTFTLDGVALSLDGAEVKIQIRTTMNVLVGEWTTGSGITIVGPALSWAINDTETEEFPVGVHNYDVEITLSEMKRTYITGKFTVVKDITV